MYTRYGCLSRYFVGEQMGQMRWTVVVRCDNSQAWCTAGRPYRDPPPCTLSEPIHTGYAICISLSGQASAVKLKCLHVKLNPLHTQMSGTQTRDAPDWLGQTAVGGKTLRAAETSVSQGGMLFDAGQAMHGDINYP